MSTTTFTDAQREAYKAEQDCKTLVYGRVFAWIVATSPWYFLYQDLAILGFGRWVIGWRLFSIVPATLFLVLSYTYLRRHTKPLFWLHLLQECALIIAACGYIFGVTRIADADASNFPGAVGGLTICMVGAGALAGRTRCWLWLMFGMPMAVLIVALRFWADLPLEKMALLANPMFIGLAMVFFGCVHDRLLRREFGMRWLAGQRRAEIEKHSEHLQSVNRDLEHFAGVTSHELQQPLVTVNWWLQLASSNLEERGLLTGGVKNYMANAETTVAHMNGLVARLLTYTSLDRNDLCTEPIDLNTLFRYVVGDLDALIAEAGASVTADALPVVQADRYLMGEVLQNLFENAIKYAHPDRPPEVHVSAVETAHGCRISVSDNGSGIDPDRAEGIFTPNVRLRAEESTRSTGLGLATCRKIVHLHGGTIGVVPSGTGCTFWFSLPKR